MRNRDESKSNNNEKLHGSVLRMKSADGKSQRKSLELVIILKNLRL